MKNKHTNTPTTPAQREARSQNASKATAIREQARAARRAEAQAELEAAGIPSYTTSEARFMAAKAERAELELGRERGRYVLAEEVGAKLVTVFTACKTKLLGIPSKIRHRDPTLTNTQIALIDDQIREALEDLADAGAARLAAANDDEDPL